MVVLDLLKVFASVRGYQHFRADDVIDRLNHSFTVILLFVCTSLMAGKTFLARAIICLNDSFQVVSYSMDYIDEMCWTKGTLHMTYHSGNSTENVDGTIKFKTHIAYYQWLPFILVFLAFMFYIPYFIWKLLAKSIRIYNVPLDISGIVQVLQSVQIYKLKEFNDAIKQVTEYLNYCFIQNSNEYKQAIKHGYIDYDFENGVVNQIRLNDAIHRRPIKTKINRCLRYSLIINYILVKLLYITISCSIFWIINLFLGFSEVGKNNGEIGKDIDEIGKGFHLYGSDIITELITKNTKAIENRWNSPYFPRTVRCDIEIRDINEATRYISYNFQCGLPANIFNEKIFVVLWLWFVVLAFLNICSLFAWILRLARRRAILRAKVNMAAFLSNNNDRQISPRLFNAFIDNHINVDGFFVLQMIEKNVGTMCSRRLIESLWNTYAIANMNDQDLMTPRASGKLPSDNEDTLKLKRNLNSVDSTLMPPTPSTTNSHKHLFTQQQKKQQQQSDEENLLGKTNNKQQQQSTYVPFGQKNDMA